MNYQGKELTDQIINW